MPTLRPTSGSQKPGRNAVPSSAGSSSPYWRRCLTKKPATNGPQLLRSTAAAGGAGAAAGGGGGATGGAGAGGGGGGGGATAAAVRIGARLANAMLPQSCGITKVKDSLPSSTTNSKAGNGFGPSQRTWFRTAG